MTTLPVDGPDGKESSGELAMEVDEVALETKFPANETKFPANEWRRR